MSKGPEAFRTISEAADELGVPQHVLRFWETKFSFIRPMKRAGGRRFYRPQDLVVLKGVRSLLHDEGYTIKGVQRLHKEQGVKRLLAAGHGEGEPSVEAPPEHLIEELSEEPIEQIGAFDDILFSHGIGVAPPPPEPPRDPPAEQGLRDALSALEAAKARLNRALSNG